MITDTHTHYNDSAFDIDRDILLPELLKTCCNKIIIVGYDLKSSRKALEIAEKYDRVFAAVGVHPEECDGITESFTDELKKLASHRKIVAIGETGLDYHCEGYDRSKQTDFFERQLEAAAELKLPVIIHSRNAVKDTVDIIKRYRPKAVMHCFSGSAETASELISLGIMISFTGVLTFKNAKKAVKACEAVPLSALMLETDCPYMSPEPHRGERCHSGFLIHTAEKAAEIKKVKTDELIDICNENADRFFNI